LIDSQRSTIKCFKEHKRLKINQFFNTRSVKRGRNYNTTMLKERLSEEGKFKKIDLFTVKTFLDKICLL